jgi:MazG family protein
MSTTTDPFRELVAIVARLRDPNGGCPWDLKQTHTSLKPYLIEEAYEVIDAIDHKPATLAEELGDLLLQVVLHSQIAAEAKNFSIDEVASAIGAKLIRRHPHVFGTKTVDGVEDVLKNWEEIKKTEKSGNESVMNGIPRSLPALIRAQRAGDKSSRLGVDPTPPESEPSISDLAATLADPSTTKEQASKATGLLLWRIAQRGRELGIDSEMLLQGVTSRFSEAFVEKEQADRSAGVESAPLNPQQQASFWSKVLG